ncbi:2-C-methyl-D-erythritol 4-phosphate cytidylyltransferase [Polynucleobacter cosmopolitanus]|uniref:2-C-methyl-D-erythritol 4-phosphate cytidylyltransferase n=2 Tax=Polynucleobacter cosmopolitanus TaxID=351345 RepID=A0A229FT69_9BURK|nr:2-C-methyl-D-erythritol 4-phosphate cytidylyltransferase [Polynucleobacter cosmopolitanus]
MPKLHVLIPCAGTGSRMGLNQPKQFESLAGQPMALHAINTFLSMPEIASVWVGVSEENKELPQELPKASWPKDSRFNLSTTGGATRADTVVNTLKAMAKSGIDQDAWVLVHDAARPGLTVEAARRLIQAVTEHVYVSGGILAMPMADTLKLISPQNPECIGKTLPRDGLWLAQTPQMFRLMALTEALEAAINNKFEVTDEASAMERAGCEPLLVPGEWRNIKVTYPQDWALMDQILTHHSQKKENQ